MWQKKNKKNFTNSDFMDEDDVGDAYVLNPYNWGVNENTGDPNWLKWSWTNLAGTPSTNTGCGDTTSGLRGGGLGPANASEPDWQIEPNEVWDDLPNSIQSADWGTENENPFIHTEGTGAGTLKQFKLVTPVWDFSGLNGGTLHPGLYDTYLSFYFFAD